MASCRYIPTPTFFEGPEIVADKDRTTYLCQEQSLKAFGTIVKLLAPDAIGWAFCRSDAGCLHSKVVSKVRICCWGARFPNGTMITGVFENHGATGEAFATAMPFLMPKGFFPNVDASMDAQSPLFDRAPRSGQMAACTQAGCKLLLDLEACQLFLNICQKDLTNFCPCCQTWCCGEALC